MDPAVYIIYHEKYRQAIKNLLYVWSNGKVSFLRNEKELTTGQSAMMDKTKINDIETSSTTQQCYKAPVNMNQMDP